MTELILSGRVQGVFCRHYCSQNAKRLGLRGSATNLMDGTVRVVLDTDDEAAVQNYIRVLRENSFGVRFWGTITGIRVEKNRDGAPGGDYTF
ncbi:MAG: acylphosphatase [Spirochaetes bacterium]|nr:acylphosphatase [Spirochaetota bacterium]